MFFHDADPVPGVAALRKLMAAGLRETALEDPIDVRDPRLQAYLLHIMAHRREELLLGFFADDEGNFLGEQILAFGDANRIDLSPVAALRKAILLCASQFLLVHNHPSGSCKPSRNDLKSTRRIEKRASELGLGLMDHLIVGRGQIFSIQMNRRVR